MARALDIATFAELVVVASELSEVLTIEDDGEVVEDLAEVSGGLVAEFVGHDEVRQVHSRFQQLKLNLPAQPPPRICV